MNISKIIENLQKRLVKIETYIEENNKPKSCEKKLSIVNSFKTIKYVVSKNEDMGFMSEGSVIQNVQLIQIGDFGEGLIYIPEKAIYRSDGETCEDYGFAVLRFAEMIKEFRVFEKMKINKSDLTKQEYRDAEMCRVPKDFWRLSPLDYINLPKNNIFNLNNKK